MKRLSQNEKILQALREHPTGLTHKQLRATSGSECLTARIAELRKRGEKEGFMIKCHWDFINIAGKKYPGFVLYEDTHRTRGR
jgi:hypothetical protein